MKRTLLCSAASLLLLALSPPDALAANPKAKTDPDKLEFSVKKEGKRAGVFSFKCVEAKTGNRFCHSSLELNRGGNNLSVKTHLKVQANGKLSKYKKWIGNSSHKPAYIAFWKGPKLRVIKNTRKKFRNDLEPPENFLVIDKHAPYLMLHLAAAFKRGEAVNSALYPTGGEIVGFKVLDAGATAARKKKAKPVALMSFAIESSAGNGRIHMDGRNNIYAMEADGLVYVKKGYELAHPVMIRAEPEADSMKKVEKISPAPPEKAALPKIPN